jgi:hypothetical protein
MTDWQPYPDNKPKAGHYQLKLRTRAGFYLAYGHYNGYFFEGESGWPIPDADVIAFREWNEDYEE